MHSNADFDVWNLTDGGVARCGAVEVFNIVGCLKRPREVAGFAYWLNGSEVRPICFNNTLGVRPRITHPGEFNIDTITHSQLTERNIIAFEVRYVSGEVSLHTIEFRVRAFDPSEREFSLDLDGCTSPEEVGQIVEGPWRIAVDPSGRRCLEITPEGAGYDRIILFGSKGWTSGYEVIARIHPTRILDRHNLGLVYRWNPHEQGDGRCLPTTWSTGLALYRSYRPSGLKLRFGVQVRLGEDGQLLGDHVMATGRLHYRRYLWSSMLRLMRLTSWRTELELNQDYLYRLRIAHDVHALTVWPADRTEPAPQVVVPDPPDLLPSGSVGVLGLWIAMRVYEFTIRPIAADSASGSPRVSAAPTHATDTNGASARSGTLVAKTP